MICYQYCVRDPLGYYKMFLSVGVRIPDAGTSYGCNFIVGKNSDACTIFLCISIQAFILVRHFSISKLAGERSMIERKGASQVLTSCSHSGCVEMVSHSK